MSKIFTKEGLKIELCNIRDQGWIKARVKEKGVENYKEIAFEDKRDSAVGDTLEYLLGIPTNNLPIPNAADWELKAQKVSDRNKSSLVTLKHIEPSPKSLKMTSSIMLPIFGWPHDDAGGKYPNNEMSFRLTISSCTKNGRGFHLAYDEQEAKMKLVFDESAVESKHNDWKSAVISRVAEYINNNDLTELPMPYWGINDLYCSLQVKLKNCFFAEAKVKKGIDGNLEVSYSRFYMLSGFSEETLKNSIRSGDIYVDFDARTGHNHGTKIRMTANSFKQMFLNLEEF